MAISVNYAITESHLLNSHKTFNVISHNKVEADSFLLSDFKFVVVC